MSSSKAALKAVGAAIHAHKYSDAVQQAEKLLASEPKSYQAYIFLGFAQDKQNNSEAAEKAYDAATKIKENEPQAWQGLIKLYEKQDSKKLVEYQNAVVRLALIFANANELMKAQDVVDRFLSFAKTHGTRQQHIFSLNIALPTSPIYEALEGRLPHPSRTYLTLADLIEAEERERINKEIGERRTRLGAKIGKVTTEVKREVYMDSPLEEIYSKVIDWSNDDEVRRRFEEKLVQRCFDTLCVLPAEHKLNAAPRVQKLASDMVIIKHPFKLAWDIAIEWQDQPSLSAWDPNVLREYCEYFPESGLARVLEGFMSSEVCPFPKAQGPPVSDSASEDSQDEDEGGGVGLMTTEDRLLLMTEGIADSQNSILAHRILGEYYAFLDEYEVLVELMRSGKQTLASESEKTGLAFDNASQSLSALLGTALVYYQSPRNHAEAKALFDDILAQNPTSTSALLGVGMIYHEEEDYLSAMSFFNRALDRDPTIVRIKIEAAWAKALSGDYESGKEDLEACLALINGSDTRSRELRAQVHYRIGVCLWNIDPSKTARKNRSGAYASFLAALKSNLNLAPAYTSLGIFYADYAKDRKRARKCFQQAFELSASEVESAERLARLFAEQKEWDLVEVVAQRVVESGRTRPPPGSKKKGISWPYAALGVAELNKQDFPKSIVSFQSALRISPEDYHSWVGLAESYHSMGRFIAATKAFQHAEQYESEIEKKYPGQTWFAKYMLANVKRDLGDFQSALESYRQVLASRPDEFVVSIALVQTLVEAGWDSVDKGLFGQAASYAAEALSSARTLSDQKCDTFNLWKAAGDACSIYSWVQSRLSEFPASDVFELVSASAPGDFHSLLSEVDGVGLDVVFSKGLWPEDEKEGVELTKCLHASILCHKRAIANTLHDVHSQAVAYFNLGVAEYRAHVCLRLGLRTKSTRYLKTALRCFKRAIELEAGNAEFWSALGVVTSELNPMVAQHAFVRSLFLNERSSQTWTNLGALYLIQNDQQLANEAFTRGQSADPEYAQAWIGQGLLALMFGDPKEARLLFTHAEEISTSSSAFVKQQYSISTFDSIVESTLEADVTHLVHPLFALDKIQSMTPRDVASQHLRTMFLERVNDTSTALEILTRICKKAEADYEVTESATSLSQFALAEADLARSELANLNFDEAITHGETSLQLSEPDAGSQLTPESRKKCRLSAHLTVGLAKYHLDQVEEAVEYFETALTESNDDPGAVCLLAQVLWATGKDEARQSAQDRLFDCVEKHPGHVRLILLLGIIALLDGDTESLEAVKADLLGLRTDASVSAVEQGQIGDVLRGIAAFSAQDHDGIISEVQTDVFLFPGQPYGWTRLASLTADEHASDMSLKMATRAVKAKSENDSEGLARALAGTGKVSDAQRAIIMAPWIKETWAGLHEGVSTN